MLQLKPDDVPAHNDIGQILIAHPDLKSRDIGRAIKLAERAAELTKHQDVTILETLAAAYAAAGRFDQAVNITQTAINLAVTAKNNELVDSLRRQLESYKQAKP